MPRRVVITGASAITPIGVTKESIWDGLMQGRSGVKSIKDDPLLGEHLRSKVFGTVTDELTYDFERHHRKTMGPVSFYACHVAKESLDQAGLDQEFIHSGRMGVAFGSTHGSPSVQRSIYEKFFKGGDNKLKGIGGADYLKSMVHTTAANVARMFGITGRIISSCTACTTSAQSIGFGFESVKFGMQDAMLCGGADEYDTTTVAVFDNLLACSTAYNDSPEKTPRPFDEKRDGLVVAEGAGAVILEEYEHAKNRGAVILGEVLGFACGNNGDSLIMPDAAGIERTIRAGLQNAGIEPQQVDLVTAHATGTKLGDATEAMATASVFGKGPWVVGLKGYMGHSMGSCGVIESICSLMMMEHGKVVPTLNLENIDPRCDGIKHPGKIIDDDIKTVVIQNFAFGGVNTCLVLHSPHQ